MGCLSMMKWVWERLAFQHCYHLVPVQWSAICSHQESNPEWTRLAESVIDDSVNTTLSPLSLHRKKPTELRTARAKSKASAHHKHKSLVLKIVLKITDILAILILSFGWNLQHFHLVLLHWLLHRSMTTLVQRSSYWNKKKLWTSSSIRQQKIQILNSINQSKPSSPLLGHRLPNMSTSGTPILSQYLQLSPSVTSFFDVCFQITAPSVSGSSSFPFPLWIPSRLRHV